MKNKMNQFIKRIYKIHKTLLYYNQRDLFTELLRENTKEDLYYFGVTFQNMIVVWDKNKQRFMPINFLSSLSEEQFLRLEDLIYFSIINGESIDKCEEHYYTVQIEDEEPLFISLDELEEEELLQEEMEYDVSNRYD